jgi:hypothetical protein
LGRVSYIHIYKFALIILKCYIQAENIYNDEDDTDDVADDDLEAPVEEEESSSKKRKI